MTPELSSGSDRLGPAWHRTTFDAVDDLVAAFIEDPTEEAWRHADVVERLETGGYDAAIVRSRQVLAVIEVEQLRLFGIGVPAEGD